MNLPIHPIVFLASILCIAASSFGSVEEPSSEPPTPSHFVAFLEIQDDARRAVLTFPGDIPSPSDIQLVVNRELARVTPIDARRFQLTLVSGNPLPPMLNLPNITILPDGPGLIVSDPNALSLIP